MLTSNDLIKIDNLITKKTEEIVERVIDNKVNFIVKKHLQVFEKKIIKKLNLVISLFENNHVALEGRVMRIEKHLNLN